MRDKKGYLIEQVVVDFDVLAESNSIPIKDIIQSLAKSVTGINGESYYGTAANVEGKIMNQLKLNSVPENRIEEVTLILQSKLADFKSQGEINSYLIK